MVIGQYSIQNEFRPGRPKLIIVPENINGVQKLIKQDLHVKYYENDVSLNISMPGINDILHE